MSFDCSKCGACCRMVGTLPEMRDYDRGDGACKYLTPANLCAIYETRPPLCRVDLMRPPVMTEPEWHRRNHAECERIHLHVYGSR